MALVPYEKLLNEAIRSLAVDSGTVTSPAAAGTNILNDNTKNWAAGIHNNRLVKIISGAGAGQQLEIDNNVARSLILKQTWVEALDATSVYVILEKNLAQILRDVLGGGSDISAANPLQVYDPKVSEALGGLVLNGVVTAVPGANQFTIPTLAGLGAGKFADATAPYGAFVLRDAAGTGAAPQGEMQTITAYDSPTGTFTTNAFTAAVDVGDEVLIMHPALAGAAGIAAVMADVGDASTSTLGSLYGILGNPAQSFLTMIGYEGATSLANKLTAARALLLDNLDAAISSRATPGAAMDLLAATITAIRQSVTAAGDPANSIGKALYDLYVNRLTAARAGYLDELAAANIPADIDWLKTTQSRQLHVADYWSVPQEAVVVPAVAANQSLPDVVVYDLPTGITIVRVIAMFKFRMVENTNAAANKINGLQVIQVRDDTPSAWENAIDIVDDMFTLEGEAREGGDVIIGHDGISIVDGNDTYNFQWTSAAADLASLEFNDVQVGLRIWYKV